MADHEWLTVALTTVGSGVGQRRRATPGVEPPQLFWNHPNFSGIKSCLPRNLLTEYHYDDQPGSRNSIHPQSRERLGHGTTRAVMAVARP